MKQTGERNGHAELSRRRPPRISPKVFRVSILPRASRLPSPSARSRWRSTAVPDLSDPIARRQIEFLNREDPRALELIRHDAAHVLAEAVQALWPGTQVTIGPVIENGFYYDFFRNQPFTPEDLPAIEEDARDHRARPPLHQGSMVAREAKRLFRDKGEQFKVELVDAIPEDQELKIYRQGEWFDLCRGPHMTSTGKIGNAFKLMKVAGAYWRGDSNREMLSRIYGTAFAKQEELDAYLHRMEEAEKRDHRKLGREMDLFHFQEEGPGTCSGTRPAGRMFQEIVALYAPPPEEATIRRSTPRSCSTSLWETSGHWGWFRENMFQATVGR